MTASAKASGRRSPVLVPIAALVVAMISFQYGATVAKGLFPLVGVEGTTTLRLGLGAVILGAVSRPWRSRPSGRVALALLGYGAALGVMNLCFYLALRTVPLGIAVAVEFSGPFLVATLSSRRLADFTWIGLAVCGLLMLSPLAPTGRPLDPAGVMFALAAGACWALYIVLGTTVGRELGSQATAIGMAIAAVLILPVGAPHLRPSLLAPSVLASALLVGVFSSALPFSLEMTALTRMPARLYGTLTSLEPGVGALMGVLLLHERLSTIEWVGIAVVVAAAAGAAATIRTSVPLPD